MSAFAFVEINIVAFDPVRDAQAKTSFSPSPGLDALAAARRLGHEVVVAAQDPAFYGPEIDRRVDRWVVCDTRDAEATARALAGSGAVAVTTFIDQFLGVAAAVARALGVPGPDPGSPALSRSKARVRAALDAAGVPNARWAVVPAASPLPAPLALPCIAKPVDGSGSWDVVRVSDEAELAAAAERHAARHTYGRGVAPRHELLLEQELRGPLFSAEGFVAGDDVELWGYSDRDLAEPPLFYETGSTFSGELPHPGAPAFVREVLRASGYDLGAFHLELIVTADGPRLVELNPRLIGGGAHQCVNLACGGVDVVEHVLRRLLGEPGALSAVAASTLRDVYPPRAGRVTRVAGLERARSSAGVRRVELRCSPGDEVRDPRSNSENLGYVLTEGPDARSARERAERAAAQLQLELEPLAEPEAA